MNDWRLDPSNNPSDHPMSVTATEGANRPYEHPMSREQRRALNPEHREEFSNIYVEGLVPPQIVKKRRAKNKRAKQARKQNR